VIGKIDFHINALESMKKYPKELFYKGNLELLKRPKVTIVGTRKPSNYTKEMVYQISKALASRGVCIVSGGAMGVDALAHSGAGVDNTICVLGNSLDIYYPAVNKNLLTQIAQQGLLLSQFSATFKATPWSFVVRNELVVALGDIVIIAEASMDSGSMRSADFALAMKKKLFVLPHCLNESSGTNMLLKSSLATPIYDIEEFSSHFGVATQSVERDEFYYFCQKSPTLDSAIEKFGSRVYEAELEGVISVENGLIRLA